MYLVKARLRHRFDRDSPRGRERLDVRRNGLPSVYLEPELQEVGAVNSVTQRGAKVRDLVKRVKFHQCLAVRLELSRENPSSQAPHLLPFGLRLLIRGQCLLILLLILGPREVNRGMAVPLFRRN